MDPMNIDWRSEVNAIAPLTGGEQFANAVRAGDPFRFSPGDQRQGFLTPEVYKLIMSTTAATSGTLATPWIDSFPPYVPTPIAQPKRLAWWRRLAIRLLGGEA